MKNKTPLIIAVLLTGVFCVQIGTVVAATDKTPDLSEPEAVYAQLRAAIATWDKAKIKSLLDASMIDHIEKVLEKSFDKITADELQDELASKFPDIVNFEVVSSDTKGNKLYSIRKLDEPSGTDRILTNIICIEFIKQTDGKTWKIGFGTNDLFYSNVQDKKNKEKETNISIRRIRRKFGLKIKKMSLKQQLEEADSETTEPSHNRAWSEGTSMSIKFIEAVKTGNHAAYIRLDGTGNLHLFSFILKNGEWKSQPLGASNYISNEKLSKSRLKKKTDEMKNTFFAVSTVIDFIDSMWDGDYQTASKLFAISSNQTVDEFKGFFDQSAAIKSYFYQKEEIKEKSAVFLVSINGEKLIISLIKENGIWKIAKIVPDTSKID